MIVWENKIKDLRIFTIGMMTFMIKDKYIEGNNPGELTVFLLLRKWTDFGGMSMSVGQPASPCDTREQTEDLKKATYHGPQPQQQQQTTEQRPQHTYTHNSELYCRERERAIDNHSGAVQLVHLYLVQEKCKRFTPTTEIANRTLRHQVTRA